MFFIQKPGKWREIQFKKERDKMTEISDRIKSQASSGRCSARVEGLSHSRPTICGNMIKILSLSPNHLKCLQINPITSNLQRGDLHKLKHNCLLQKCTSYISSYVTEPTGKANISLLIYDMFKLKSKICV